MAGRSFFAGDRRFNAVGARFAATLRVDFVALRDLVRVVFLLLVFLMLFFLALLFFRDGFLEAFFAIPLSPVLNKFQTTASTAGLDYRAVKAARILGSLEIWRRP